MHFAVNEKNPVLKCAELKGEAMVCISLCFKLMCYGTLLSLGCFNLMPIAHYNLVSLTSSAIFDVSIIVSN